MVVMPRKKSEGLDNPEARTSEPKYEALLPEVVTEVTQEWADSKALGLPMMYAEGESLAEVCRDLGITKAQYRECVKISDSFNAADAYAQVVSEAAWHKLGREGAGGRRVNGSVWAANMNNRYGWTNSGGEAESSSGKTLNIGIVFMGKQSDTTVSDTLRDVIDIVPRLTVVKHNEDEL